MALGLGLIVRNNNSYYSQLGLLRASVGIFDIEICRLIKNESSQ